METMDRIQQLLVEQKFFEAQKLIEASLTQGTHSRHHLLLLLFESLFLQQKEIPPELLIDLAEKEFELRHFDRSLELLNKIKLSQFETRVLKIKFSIAQERGQIKILYDLVSDHLLRLFEKQIPHIPDWIRSVIDKYFRDDFNILIKILAIELAVNHLEKAEELLRELILSSVERSSPKVLNNRLLALCDILKSSIKGHLDIYYSLCLIHTSGIQEKAQYKKIIEMIIYFDDFKFQVMVLDLLNKIELKSEAEELAQAIRKNTHYSYVYLDKYFPHLKRYFFKPQTSVITPEQKLPTPDIELTEKYWSSVVTTWEIAEEPEEVETYIHLLKHTEFSVEQLCDIAVGFLQAEVPRAALAAAERALQSSSNRSDFLKASYLKISALFLLKDFRVVIDTCLNALEKVESTADLLSFLYAQGEAYIRMGLANDARIILKQIIKIDSSYRLAKERLEKLNEI